MTLLAARHYTPFGIQRNAGGLDEEVPFGFTGHQMDPELGLINMRGRIYDPHLGQFLSADPLMTDPEGPGLNRFAYVANAPLNATDPTGLRTVCWNCPDYSAFPGSVSSGVGTAGTDATVQPSASAPSSPASAGATPGVGGNALSGGEAAAGSPGDAFSLGSAGGYAASNGPAIAMAGIEWADSARMQKHTYQAVAPSSMQPASDAAVGNYGSKPSGMATDTAAERPPGTSLFDTGSGAQACNGGGDVCLEILRQQQAEQLRIIRENIKAVEELEWELFWAYSGGGAIKWGLRGYQAWRVGRGVAVFATKQAAREALSGPLGQAANRFFRDAAKNARDFRIIDLAEGGKRFEFFSPARNAGYGKLYVQEVDQAGKVLREFKNTMGPKGLIETKWLHGGP